MNPTLLLAGRRPDPEDADVERFPIANAVAVRERLRALVVERRPSRLVCSAACGADLLALDVAGDLGVERHVILPFDSATFRASSVIDRPGSWGGLYDRLVGEIEASGGLTVLDESPGSDAAYEAVNDLLLRRAQELGLPILGVAVWEGEPRGEGDLTAHLLQAVSGTGAETERGVHEMTPPARPRGR